MRGKNGLATNARQESSFLDWREQSYPEWMEPADIYEYETLGTNAIHFKTLELLVELAGQLEYHENREKR